MTASFAHPPAQPDWSNLRVLHKNTLPPRSHFHVYTSEEDALSDNIRDIKDIKDMKDPTFYPLSGTWKFHHSCTPFEAPEGFESESFDVSSWSEINVPGMWQLQGFGKGPHYTNVNFPFPVNPPHVSFTQNETGSYVRTFKVPLRLKDCQIRLRFEGVDSAFHAWINGKSVGYSQGSRNPDEFDITGLVKMEEDNLIAVRVYQFCDGSYIEDQDQWRMSGIFRDVFLIGFPQETRIEDVHVQTCLDQDYKDADLKAKVVVTGNGDVRIKLLNADDQELVSELKRSSGSGSVEFSLKVKSPLKWTAETPNLYRLIVSFGDQFFAQRIGFRQVEMKDGLLKVNGKRIVFRGVNRHEHHPTLGRAVPLEFLKEDLLIMKRHNINAIRTSHQPNDPRLYYLADEMGFWIIDEADLECHGFEPIADAALSGENRALPFRERQILTRKDAAQWTTDNPDWEEAYVDRAKHLVIRDKNHPSVIVWSLGNEAFFGRNFKSMYGWIKSYDDSRPIHYEPDINAEVMDMYSVMYPPVEEIVRFGEDKEKKKPLILCEYIHAMGNGPGNIKEYIDAFYKYPKLQGGFAWEWANHGLLAKDEKTGEQFYAYGGDFGDAPNDSTFVMDGLLNSDHTPNPGLVEYKKAIEPVQLLESSNSSAKFINRYDFLTLDHLECFWSTTSEGRISKQDGLLPIPPGVSPNQTFDLALSPLPQLQGESYFNISFRLKEATLSLPTHFVLATAQIPVSSSPPLLQPPSSPSSNLTIERPCTQTLVIANKSSEKVQTFTFNTVHGSLTSWIKNETELISDPPKLTVYRAPTDNDLPQDGWDWKDRRLDEAEPHNTSADVEKISSGVIIRFQQRIAPPVLSWSITATITYTISTSGALSIHVHGEPRGENLPKTLPRVGLELAMPKQFDKLEWFGRGPGESYRDSKLSQHIGYYTVNRINDLGGYEDYDVPQEAGNRTDTRWLKLSTVKAEQSSTELFVQFKDLSSPDESKRTLFDFQASHYRAKDVAGVGGHYGLNPVGEKSKGHPYQLRKKKREEVILRLDAAHHGLGSGSCGPKTREEYALKCKDFEFEVVMF